MTNVWAYLFFDTDFIEILCITRFFLSTEAASNVKAQAIAMRQEGMQANKNAAQDLRAQLKAGQQPGTSGQSGNGNANPRKRPADDGMK